MIIVKYRKGREETMFPSPFETALEINRGRSVALKT